MDRDGFAPQDAPDPDSIRVLDPRLTLAARVALYAVAALSLATLVATWNEIGAFDEFRRLGTAGAITAVGEAEQLSEGFVTLVVYVGIATGVLTITWWVRAYRAIEASGARGLRWSPGWALGGWFIPLANLVIAKMVLDEIDRVSQAVAEGDPSWRSRRLTPITGWWWGFWAGGLVIGLIGTALVSAQLGAPSFDAASYRTGLVALLVAHAASMVAGFCGAASLRVLGERLDRA